jgi:hypothetical protein
VTSLKKDNLLFLKLIFCFIVESISQVFSAIKCYVLSMASCKLKPWEPSFLFNTSSYSLVEVLMMLSRKIRLSHLLALLAGVLSRGRDE